MPDDYESTIQTYEDIAQGYADQGRNQNLEGSRNLDPNTSGYNYNINRTGQTKPGFYGSYSTPSGGLVTIGAPPPGPHDRGRSVAGPGRTGGDAGSRITRPGGGGGGGGGRSVSLGYQGPTVARPEYQTTEFEAPGKFQAPEYKPPERDEAVEAKLRDQYMAPGMRQVRKGTSQAILSSKSLDNPNTRAMFIERALGGVGDAISKVAGTAGREASTEASRRYGQDMEKYHFGYNAKSNEAKIQYDSEWKQAIMDFQEQRTASQRAYETQANVFRQMPLAQQAGALPGGGGSPTGSRTGYTGAPGDYNKWFDETYG